MTQHVENYCARTEMLLRMLEGDLSRYVSEHVRGEIRRVLRFEEPPLEPSTDPLVESDE